MSRNNERNIRIQYSDGKVSSLPLSRADKLVQNGEAKFISKTLFKAISAGINPKKIKDTRADIDIKKLIKTTIEKRDERKSKKKN